VRPKKRREQRQRQREEVVGAMTEGATEQGFGEGTWWSAVEREGTTDNPTAGRQAAAAGPNNRQARFIK
jgi:hypothetical protein